MLKYLYAKKFDKNEDLYLQKQFIDKIRKCDSIIASSYCVDNIKLTILNDGKIIPFEIPKSIGKSSILIEYIDIDPIPEDRIYVFSINELNNNHGVKVEKNNVRIGSYACGSIRYLEVSGGKTEMSLDGSILTITYYYNPYVIACKLLLYTKRFLYSHFRCKLNVIVKTVKAY